MVGRCTGCGGFYTSCIQGCVIVGYTGALSDAPIVLVHIKEDNLSIKDKTAEFILSPMCPLLGGSSVHQRALSDAQLCKSTLFVTVQCCLTRGFVEVGTRKGEGLLSKHVLGYVCLFHIYFYY